MIHFVDHGTPQPVAFAKKGRLSIVVRVELEDVPFALSAAEPESTKGNFAESLAQQIALLAVEKDLPDGIEPSLSAEQIDQIPPDCENRLPDFCVHGNEVWLVDTPLHNVRFLQVGPQCFLGLRPG